MNKTAHYFATKGQKFVIISADTRPQGERHDVATKKAARELAKTLNAKPWNF